MTSLLEGLGNEIKDVLFEGENSIEKELFNIKKEIALEYVNNIKKQNPSIEIIKDNIVDYLVNEGKIEDVFKDIFRGAWLSLLLPESAENLNKIKEKLSSVKRIPTSEELTSLKSEIMCIDLKIQETSIDFSDQSNQSIGNSQRLYYNTPKETQELKESENKFINAVYKRAAQLVGTRYKFGGKNPSTGIDCSGLWQRAFTQEGIKFSGGFNAHAFSDADVDIEKEQVKLGDFMFWDQKPGTKKHNSIYHIEMVVSKPYTKNGKTYVRTLGSSSDAKDDRGNYVGNGVQFREREMKDYRHYGRPTYFYQLAQHEKTGSNSDLVATTGKPSQNLENHVKSA